MQPSAENGDGGAALLRFHPSSLRDEARPPLHVANLYDLLGREVPLDEGARALRHYVQSERAPVVGAVQVACSDAAEREGVDAFRRQFVAYCLPSLKFHEKAALETRTLGARYEWGSAPLAETQFSLARGAEKWKLVVVKINAHVSVVDEPSGPVFGSMQRFDGDSVYCGALRATLDGARAPFAGDLEASFGFEGVDRLAELRDPFAVEPSLQALFAAVASARLQARRAMIDVQDRAPATPTLWLVLPAVTLNRRAHDTEILCGIYTADRRGDERHDEYCGVGDRPSAYRLELRPGSLAVRDDEIDVPRLARDHRAIVREHARERSERVQGDPRLAHAMAAADHHRRRGAGEVYAKPLAHGLLGALLEVAPVPAALLLFGEGFLHVHHAARAHRLMREAEADGEARELLEAVRADLGELPPERADHLVRLLVREYGHKA